MKYRLKVLLSAALSLALGHTAAADDDAAGNLVRAQPCVNGENIDDLLKQKARHSQRDLGWHVYSSDDGLEVERAYMVSKAMEIRYRWRVTADGHVFPANKRAEELCS